MMGEVELHSWWVPVKNQEAERGYKGKFPESVIAVELGLSTGHSTHSCRAPC